MPSYYISFEQKQGHYLSHHGILGQKWGVRRFQNKDGTRTPAGKKRYTWLQDKLGFDERDRMIEARRQADAAKMNADLSYAYANKKHASVTSQERQNSNRQQIEEAKARVDWVRSTPQRLYDAGFTAEWGYDTALKYAPLAEKVERGEPLSKDEMEEYLALGGQIAFIRGYLESVDREVARELPNAINNAANIEEQVKNEDQELTDEWKRSSKAHALAMAKAVEAAKNAERSMGEYKKSPLGRLESAKATVKKGVAFVKSLFKRSK